MDNNIIRPQIMIKELLLYHKSQALYDITFHFAHKYFMRGDRTIDQMIQAARSGKQNIVEGIEGGATSTESELKLLNVARASIQELREDYEDYLRVRNLACWKQGHPHFDWLLAFCRQGNTPDCYTPHLQSWSGEIISNISISLCHILDKMLTNYIAYVISNFQTNGGIRERMYNTRRNYLADQKQHMQQLEETVRQQQQTIQQLHAEIQALKHPH